MGKILPVTSNQSDAIRDMANAKGVGRVNWQRGHDDGTFSRVLDDLKTAVTPPDGARIYTLRRILVTLDWPWPEAVNAAGSNTPSNYNVHKVGHLYLPTGTGVEVQDDVLLNYPEGDGNWDKALAWAESEGLKKTVPREVFAIGRQFPILHEEIRQDPMYVVATTECTFEGDRQACYVWWDGSKRGANLDWVSFFDNANDWFAFRKTSILGT